MNRKQATFLIDHPSRDLLFSCLIGSQLNCDYDIDFQDAFFTVQGPTFFKRVKSSEKYIISPSYNVTRTPYIRLRKIFNNSKLILLHSEQFLAEVSYFEKFNLDNKVKFNKDVSLHLVWNESFKNLLNIHGIPNEKIKVIGNPKFDILKTIKKKLTYTKTGKILFITNFNAADYSDFDWEKIKKEYFLKDDDNSNHLFRKIRLNFINSILQIENYCRKNNKQIIIRKHPGELSSDYEKIQNDVIKLSTESELYKDLYDSEIVFTFTSSVVFESFILGIPTFAIEWDKLRNDLMQPPSEDYHWYSPDEIENIIIDPIKYKCAINKSIFETHFGSTEKFSTSIAAKEINEFMENDNPKFSRNFFAFLNKFGLIFFFKYLFNLIAINKPKFLFKYFYNKVNASYSKWFMNDHYVSIEEIVETKIKAINILKNENII
jgi:surface carbohydrate biosynthesis protein